CVQGLRRSSTRLCGSSIRWIGGWFCSSRNPAPRNRPRRRFRGT
ncbi:uncharacterized protein METZ01_LOCUS156342, partial [marine metagenome]